VERDAFEKELEDLGLRHQVKQETPFYEMQEPGQYSSLEVPTGASLDPCVIPENEKPIEPVMGVPLAPPFRKDAYWPLVSSEPPIVEYRKRGGGSTPGVGPHGRQFMALRKRYDKNNKYLGEGYHPAIDLYAKENDLVIAIENGEITRFVFFYLGTWGIVVKHEKMTVIYGEVNRDSLFFAGLQKKVGPFFANSSKPPIPVKAGQVIGRVVRNTSEKRSAMLHTEIFDNDYKRNVPWLKGKPNPHRGLYDPTLALVTLARCGKRTTGSPQASLISTTSPSKESVDLANAVLLNRDYSVKLGWERYQDKFGRILGFMNSSPTEEEFAKAVANWQKKQGLKPDGILGPNTWLRMKNVLEKDMMDIVSKEMLESEGPLDILKTPGKIFSGKPNVTNILCGFAGFAFFIFVTEDDLRNAISTRAQTERSNWMHAGRFVREDNVSQFKFLVTYYLSSVSERVISQITPDALEAIIVNAVNPATNYNNLLALPFNPPQAALNQAIENTTRNLVAGVTNLMPGERDLVKNALRLARRAKFRDIQIPPGRIGEPWSAAFVISIIRRTAIKFGMEVMNGRTHEGLNRLVVVTTAHRNYVREAFLRTPGPNSRNSRAGTYHAFEISGRIPKVGDIIIQDRRPNRTMANVARFQDIALPAFEQQGALHGDIIVDVPSHSNFVVAIGGNIGDSARRRRYSLDANRLLVVNPGQDYVQEDDNGNLPNIPPHVPGVGLNAPLGDFNTGRIFALLSLEAKCYRFPC
jgi:Putative peptidoglycan binding domain